MMVFILETFSASSTFFWDHLSLVGVSVSCMVQVLSEWAILCLVIVVSTQDLPGGTEGACAQPVRAKESLTTAPNFGAQVGVTSEPSAHFSLIPV